MSPSFAEIAPHYDALRPLSAGDRARLETMLREAALQPGDLVVEVGCGTRRHVEEFYLNPYSPSIAVIDRPRFPSTAMLSAELRRAGFDEPQVQLIDEPRRLEIADVVDRVRGRYISTLAMLAPLEYRLGLQQLEEMLARDRSIRLTQRSEWAIITARE